MTSFLKIRIIDLGENRAIVQQIKKEFAWWGYEVFSGSGEGSTECDAIVIIDGENKPSCSIRMGEKEEKIQDSNLGEFAVKVVDALTRRLICSTKKKPPL